MKLLGSAVILTLFLFSSCGDSDRMSKVQFDEKNALEEEGIRLIPILTEMKQESLNLVESNYLEESGKARLNFMSDLSEEVEIRYSINNGQLERSHTNEFDVDFLEGNNVLVAFLSLKNGIRIPSDSSVFVRNFYLGDGKSDFESTAPHLFHCFPEEVDSASFIMGFYLSNTPQKGECQVKFTVDGIRFTLPYDRAFKVVGLSKETHNVRIQLVDENGQFIPGPFNDSGVISIRVI